MKVKTTLTAGIVAVALGGCAGATRDPDVQYSGFLGDYSILLKGGDKQAERRYLRPEVDWASYTKVLVDPVTLWRGDESRGEGVSAHDAQQMINYFHAVIYRDLQGEGLEMVTSPMPGTLRVQVALTKLDESRVVMDVMSTVVPAARALSGLDKMITGKPAFTGEAEIEYKILDAVTGELLAAGVDHRVGGKSLAALHFSSWGEVENIMQMWAAYGSYNLCKLQNRTTCVEPKI